LSLTSTGVGTVREPAACDVAELDADAEVEELPLEVPPTEGEFDASLERV